MNEQADLLDEVVAELGRRKGQLQSIARDLRIPYDTVLRIKRRENDPGYSKVVVLHRYLFPPQSPAPTPTAESRKKASAE